MPDGSPPVQRIRQTVPSGGPRPPLGIYANTRIVNGQTLGSMLLALPEGEGAAKALDYIKNYPGITYEEVGSNG